MTESPDNTPDVGGRPPKYATPQELQEAIDAYFLEIDTYNAQNTPLTRPYTMTGLAMAIDLTRQGLIEYSQKKDGGFSDSIRRAKSKVERFNEEQLYRTGQVTGVIFNLTNNFDWKHKSETDLTTKGQPINNLNEKDMEILRNAGIIKSE